MTYSNNPFQSFDKDGLPIQSPNGQPPTAQNPWDNQPAAGGWGAPTNQQMPNTYAQPQPMGYAAPMGCNQQGMPVGQVSQKSKVVAALLAFFLGEFGIHNFYLGYTQRGLIQLILFVVGCATAIVLVGFLVLFVLGIWIINELVMILSGKVPYDRDGNGVPLAS